MYLMTLLVDVSLLSVYHCSSPLGGDSSCFITVTPVSYRNLNCPVNAN